MKLAQATKEIESLKSGGVIDQAQLKSILSEVKSDTNLDQNPTVDKLMKFLGGEQLGEKIDQLSAKIEQISTQPMEHSVFTLTNFEVLRAEIDILRDEQKSRQQAFEELTEKVAEKEQKISTLERELENKENVWNGEKHQIEEKLSKMKVDQENAIEEQKACAVHLQEFTRLKESLAGTEDQTKEYLSECITKLTRFA